jgi:hypothetical protein
MDAKTPRSMLKGIDTDGLAIGINITSQVGPNRTIAMTLGVPMSMTVNDLNRFMDKAASVLDRQNDKGVAAQLKLEIERAKKDLRTAIEQKATHEAKFALEHRIGNRRGDWQASESQRKQLDNFESSRQHLLDVVIPKFEKDLADTEARIAAGVAEDE